MQRPDIDEYTSIALRVYGGCCANAFSFEYGTITGAKAHNLNNVALCPSRSLISQNAALGSALTFCQFIFIAGQSLPSFLQVDASKFPPRLSLKPRAVPLYLWIGCVVLLTAVSLLNNWAFACRVPVSLQILVRSAG